MTFLRHLAAFLALPFTVTVVVPVALIRAYGWSIDWSIATTSIGALAVSLLALLTGLILFVGSVYEFASRGRGTLAPWDPPRELVVRGPYRYVRNPMISGVLLLLVAEALVLRSVAVGIWAAAFAIINLAYIPLVEEPQLRRRFGASYQEYCRHVPRLLPRMSPWGQEEKRQPDDPARASR